MLRRFDTDEQVRAQARQNMGVAALMFSLVAMAFVFVAPAQSGDALHRFVAHFKGASSSAPVAACKSDTVRLIRTDTVFVLPRRYQELVPPKVPPPIHPTDTTVKM